MYLLRGHHREWANPCEDSHRAGRERTACMVNPFAAKVLHKRASLAVLSDERNAHLFDA